MKKIIGVAVSLFLILATLVSITSCKNKKTDDGENDWAIAGLSFKLPKSFTRLPSEDHGEFENSADDAKVFVYYCTDESLADTVGRGVNVKTYAEYYIMTNDIIPEDQTYDSKNDTFILKYVDSSGNFYFEYMLRTESKVYRIKMSCPEGKRKTYEKKFKSWIKNVSAKEELVYYTESGLNFALPDYMKKINVSYGDICFANDDSAEFFVYFYSSEGLLTECFLAMDSTVKEYWDWFSNMNGYEDIEENYDEAKKKISAKYEFDDNGHRIFFYDVIMRNEVSLIHVTLCCDAEKRNLYEENFDYWATTFALAY